jgi:hypothetical protein
LLSIGTKSRVWRILEIFSLSLSDSNVTRHEDFLSLSVKEKQERMFCNQVEIRRSAAKHMKNPVHISVALTFAAFIRKEQEPSSTENSDPQGLLPDHASLHKCAIFCRKEKFILEDFPI